MGNEVLWPLLCVSLGLILIVVEVFVPSGGLIGLLAAGLILYGVGLAFWHSTALGIRFLVGVGLALPLVMALSVYLWPRTPLARRVALRPPEAEEIRDAITDHRLNHLVGQFGRAVTPLRPAGLAAFEGRRIDSQAEEGMIPTGTLIQAVRVQGRRLIVRVAPDHLLRPFEDLDQEPNASPRLG
jgi:membrane-bound ClpP family serine protease